MLTSNPVERLHETLYSARRLCGISAMGVMPNRRLCDTTALRLAREIDADPNLAVNLAPIADMLEGMSRRETLPEQSRVSEARDVLHVLCTQVQQVIRLREGLADDGDVPDDTSPAPRP